MQQWKCTNILGPGFLESVYQAALEKELALRRIQFAHQAQALHYLAATGLELAILINFGTGSLDYRRVVKSENKNSRSLAKFAAEDF